MSASEDLYQSIQTARHAVNRAARRAQYVNGAEKVAKDLAVMTEQLDKQAASVANTRKKQATEPEAKS